MRQAGAYSGIHCGGISGKMGPHPLPLARIKKIMKRSGSGDEVKMISAEAPIAFAKACEFFIEEITKRSWVMATQSKRRTLLKDDVASALIATDVFDFLITLVSHSASPAITTTTNLMSMDS
ncbi:nuclear transcription factor Y subunit C-1-like [Senna tora]|uniref:Nuclear transcription factor Y subunit C-1-like n=1 Tax=Senna tora TaxID=362788 RepID=A0A834SWV0_9FABA|nr:nuclear transcription factor Y subunit C-1-like [Senna tora]